MNISPKISNSHQVYNENYNSVEPNQVQSTIEKPSFNGFYVQQLEVPVELWASIFQNFSRSELMKVRSICYNWKHIAGYVIKQKNSLSPVVAAPRLIKRFLNAAADNKIHKLETLLNLGGIFVDSVNSNKKTALMRAAKYGCVSIVEKLLEAGASVNAKEDRYKRTVLMYASQNGNIEVVMKLLGAEADIHPRGGKYRKTALMYAAQNGHIKVVTQLIDAGAEVNTKDKDDWTALEYAYRKNRVEVITKLLEVGAVYKVSKGRGSEYDYSSE